MSIYAQRPWQRHYDYWVPQTMRYPERPLYDILDTSAVDFPDSPATAFFGATLTFAEIKARSDRFANALAGFGISKMRPQD
jgi:acyl-CoA synthetase (AMP-forming)/AMP-acid ligase II